MRANIQAVSLKIQTLKSQSAMANAMKGVTKAMGNMNKQMKLPEIQKIMMEFEKQSEIMDMKGEMMEDAIGNDFEYNIVYTAHCGNYKNLLSHIFGKKFVKVTFLLKKYITKS